MKLEPHDIHNVVMDLYFFFSENPNHKLPMRYLWLLAKIVASQLSGHPAVTDDVLADITIVGEKKPTWSMEKDITPTEKDITPTKKSSK